MDFDVTYQEVEPDPIWMTVEGVFFPLTGPFLFLYRMARFVDGEEKANRDYHQYIMNFRAEWLRKREAVTAPQQITAQTLKQGI